MGAELFHVDRRTDGHDEANSYFSQFFERAQKMSVLCVTENNDTSLRFTATDGPYNGTHVLT